MGSGAERDGLREVDPGRMAGARVACAHVDTMRGDCLAHSVGFKPVRGRTNLLRAWSAKQTVINVARRPGASMLAAVVIILVAACGSTPVPPPSSTTLAAPSAVTTPTARATGGLTASTSPTAITREAAIALAQKAAPAGSKKAVLEAVAGRFEDLRGSGQTEGKTPAPDDWVWRLDLGEYGGPTGGSGTVVVLDYYDGHVIQIYTWAG